MATNYVKLKTNLRLSIQRMKMVEKKKTELAQKLRKEIGEYLTTNKLERARIRVEYIIREDYLVEAIELVEMYCDLLITRFGLIEQLKTLDDGLAEAISSLLWVAPRLQADIPELKIVSELLIRKYGKQYAQVAQDGNLSTISEKLKNKMAIEAPPKFLVEQYIIEIAKALDINYKPDNSISNEKSENNEVNTEKLIDLENENFFPDFSSIFIDNNQKNQHIIRPIGFDISNIKEKPNILENKDLLEHSPPPNYDSILKKEVEDTNNYPEMPENLPNSPLNTKNEDDSNNDIDFDDLVKRFEALKKKKD